MQGDSDTMSCFEVFRECSSERKSFPEEYQEVNGRVTWLDFSLPGDSIIWGVAYTADGAGLSEHIHPDYDHDEIPNDEIYVVLSGEVSLPDHKILNVGEAAYIPTNTIHGLSSKGEARSLWAFRGNRDFSAIQYNFYTPGSGIVSVKAPSLITDIDNFENLHDVDGLRTSFITCSQAIGFNSKDEQVCLSVVGDGHVIAKISRDGHKGGARSNLILTSGDHIIVGQGTDIEFENKSKEGSSRISLIHNKMP